MDVLFIFQFFMGHHIHIRSNRNYPTRGGEQRIDYRSKQNEGHFGGEKQAYVIICRYFEWR